MNKIQEQQFDDLLDKFLEGKTTGQEADDLMDLLDDVADEYMPEGMEARLESFVQDLDQPEQKVAPVIHHNFIHRYAIAACAALVLAVGLAFHVDAKNNAFTDTCSTPEEAETQMIRALTMLNSRSQQGIDDALEMMERPVQQRDLDLSKYINFE